MARESDVRRQSIAESYPFDFWLFQFLNNTSSIMKNLSENDHTLKNPYEEESTESTVDDEMEYDPNYVDPYYSVFITHE